MEEDSLAGLCLIVGSTAAVGCELARQGWTMTRLATLQDLEDGDLLDLLDHFHELAKLDVDLSSREFREIIETAATLAVRSHREEMRRGEGALLRGAEAGVNGGHRQEVPLAHQAGEAPGGSWGQRKGARGDREG